MRLGQNQNCQKKGKKKKKAYISQYWVFFIYSVCVADIPHWLLV